MSYWSVIWSLDKKFYSWLENSTHPLPMMTESCWRTSKKFCTLPKLNVTLTIWGESWLVVWGLKGVWDSISVYIGPSPREREKEKRNDRREKKCPNNPPPAPNASTVGPCPTLLQISRTPRHWKLTQHHHTTGPPPIWEERERERDTERERENFLPWYQEHQQTS